jgi:hypothetical protein
MTEAVRFTARGERSEARVPPLPPLHLPPESRSDEEYRCLSKRPSVPQ